MYAFVRWLLFWLPSEAAHHLSFAALRWLLRVPLLGAWIRRSSARARQGLEVNALGRTFPSPIGLAAGFDKNAIGYEALAGLGFAFVEIGTVTAEPQPGNPKPRLFRLPSDRALLNRMGFNNDGSEAVATRLKYPRRTIVGVNIGKTKRVSEQDAIADYEKSTRALARWADYFVVNVSSPNTPGLRDLQAVEKLSPLLQAVQRTLRESVPERAVPLLVKIAPDLSNSDIDAVADLAVTLELDGIIATNTTISRQGLTSSEVEVRDKGAGGISGAPLKARSLEVLQRLRQRVGGRLVLISVGGIETTEDVWQRLQAGATLVQLYTGFVYGGPWIVHRMHRELIRRLERAQLSSVAQLYPAYHDARGNT